MFKISAWIPYHTPFLSLTKIFSKSIAFYQKPHLDLLTPISDDLQYKSLWSSPDQTPIDLPKNFKNFQSNILFKSSLLKSWKLSRIPELRSDLKVINDMIINSFPISMNKLKKMFLVFPYPGKWVFSELLINWTKCFKGSEFMKKDLMEDFEKRQVKNKIYQFCYCYETIVLALYLNSLIGNEKLKKNGFMHKMLLNKMTDQKLLLAADFFHTKASRMSSLIGKVEITNNLSKIEEEAAKSTFLQQKTPLSIEDKLEIAYYETGIKLGYGFQSVALILLGNEDEETLNESFEKGANLGIYLYLSEKYKGEDLKAERFLMNFLKKRENSKIDTKKFVSILEFI